MQDLIDDLFGMNPRAAKEKLQARGACSAADAEAVLAGLRRPTQPDDPAASHAKHTLLALIQSCSSREAAEVFVAQGTPAVVAAIPTLDPLHRAFGLKILALSGSRASFAALVTLIKDPEGPKDFFVSTALGAVNPKSPHLDVLFPALTPLLAFDDFRSIAVLDLANRVALKGGFSPHPAAQHLGKLRALLTAADHEHDSYACSSCLALAFIPGDEARQLLGLGCEHANQNVRLEAAYALARRGEVAGFDALAKASGETVTSGAAVAYLEEFGRRDLVPPKATLPAFEAEAEMISWLAHPMEYGRPPSAISLWDRRTLHWPPTGDDRDFFLFRYEYPPRDGETAPDVGVGLVGSVTFSLFGETKPAPDGTPEDALAAHCAWELRNQGGKSTLEEARRLLGFVAPLKKVAARPPTVRKKQ